MERRGRFSQLSWRGYVRDAYSFFFVLLVHMLLFMLLKT